MSLKTSLLLPLLFLSVCALAQKEKYVVVKGSDRPESGYPSKGKIEEGKYVDNKKEGTWLYYHKDGTTVRLKGEFVNNQPTGIYYKYHENGVLKETGSFVNNQQSDSLKHYYDNGTLEYEAWFNENGKEHGSVKYYFSSGQLEFEYNATNGVPTGEAIRYFSNGELKEKMTYDQSGMVIKSERMHAVNPMDEVNPKPENTDE